MMRARMGLRASRQFLIGTLAAVGVTALVLVLTALLSPDRFSGWAQEDAWIEWATFLSFLLASVTHVAARPKGTEGRLSELLALGLALFCLLVAGEEISWGQRLFGFAPPEVFLASNYQQELNVHNLLKDKAVGGFKLDSRYLVMLIAGLYGVLLPLLASSQKLRTTRIGKLLQLFAPRLIWLPVFAAVAAIEWVYPIDLAGEAAELFLGLGFLADALHRLAERSERAGRLGPLVLAAAVVLSIPAQGAVERLLYGSDAEAAALASAEAKLLAGDLARARTRLLQTKSRVHKRLFTAVRDGYFELGSASAFLEHRRSPAEKNAERPRRDRWGYLLDPWNNPYWVEYRRDTDELRVYSFGPNRRRDSPADSPGVDGLQPLAGDDIGSDQREAR